MMTLSVETGTYVETNRNLFVKLDFCFDFLNLQTE